MLSLWTNISIGERVVMGQDVNIATAARPHHQQQRLTVGRSL